MPNLVALLFGAAIVLFYSYNRFNRVTYEGGRQMERLVNLLSPDKLRARRIVLHAYAFYALILLLIYFFLCAYAELLPLLGGPDLAVGASKLPVPSADAPTAVIAGFAPSNDAAAIPWTLSSVVDPTAVRDFDIGINASVSLAIALIMVGLAPTFPLLGNFEDWMRGAAHRLAGIPTHVIGASEDLRRKDLGFSAAADAATSEKNRFLIPRSSWDRMAHYQAAAKDQVSEPEDFRLDLELIFAVSAWILDRKLKLANASVRERFQQLEDALHKRRDQLIVELDDRSDYGSGGAKYAAGGGTGDANLGERKRATWERIASDADDLADDLCILLALYVEHEIIVPSSMASDEDTAHQQFAARKKLEGFLGGLLHPHSAAGYRRSYAMTTSLWALGVVLFVSLLWSLLPGRFENELVWDIPPNAYSRMLSCIFYAFNNYCIPMIVTLALRDAGMQSRRWRNMRLAHWTLWLPQAVLVVFASWAVAAVFVMGLQLWKTGFDTGWAANGQNIWVILRSSFEYNAPTAVRGAVLALLVAFLLDAWLARALSLSLRPAYLSSLAWALGSAVIMALCGGLTRYLTSWSTKSATTQSLNAIDRGLIVYSALFSALIGFFVVFCVTAVLLNQRSSSERLRTAQASGQAAPKPAPAE
ncbi:hypothetical protein I6F26_30210 [Ensifer sp. IC3342]|nr:hypothetical protein [Ensifer sp. BRP08]MCA1450792.1 hypothetical protein [Ensifer sp. IC3342]